jgi:HSF-type DNA-binding
MEFCVDEKGRIVQKVHFARRKAVAAKSVSSGATTAGALSSSSTDESVDNGDGITPSVTEASVGNSSIAKGGVPVPFPWRLHDMLDAMEQKGKGDIVTWQPHGLAFLVKDPKAFVEDVMPHYFSQSKVCCEPDAS